MKFKVQRKINLANIDKDIWPYETEDLGVEDADSFEEAQKVVDRAVSERTGYYKARAEEYHRAKSSGAPISPPAPAVATPAIGTGAVKPAASHQDPLSTGGNSDMPAEFKI